MEAWLERFARANFARSADTAHDLKTPLNIAVLNLELLRMRLRKLGKGEEDEKLLGYARAVDAELRRMGRIFDEFFVLSTPPRNEEVPTLVSMNEMCIAVGEASGYHLDCPSSLLVEAHESRIRQALTLFFEGASNLLRGDGREAGVDIESSTFTLCVSGVPASDLELTRVFKFYYTDQEGKADLSLALARLIAETYGGELNATGDHDKVTLRLTLPLGAQ